MTISWIGIIIGCFRNKLYIVTRRPINHTISFVGIWDCFIQINIFNSCLHGFFSITYHKMTFDRTKFKTIFLKASFIRIICNYFYKIRPFLLWFIT